MPPEIVEQWERTVDERAAGADPEVNRRVAALRRQILGALHEGGVPIVMGTDSPQIFSVPGFSVHHEMALWVEVGMTPLRGAGGGDPPRRRVLSTPSTTSAPSRSAAAPTSCC